MHCFDTLFREFFFDRVTSMQSQRNLFKRLGMRLFSLFLSLVFSLGASSWASEALPVKHAVQIVSFRKHREQRMKIGSHRPHLAHPLVILDAGHGGKDPGVKMGSILEKRLALTTALLIKRALENLGYRVILTRSRDVFLPLSRRVRIANKMEGTLFASIHYNSAPNSDAKGVEVYYTSSPKDKERTKESKHLGNCVLHQMIDQTGMLSRGVKKGNFYVIRETTMPSILIEGGFMTNLQEFSQLKKREFLSKLAQGIASGVDKYLKS
ncbi:MAG TPA: hypothetical protein DHV52_00990 [Parachlamydiales bacterium]|nr:hypothetical protein [Parachlamydiales bacterium]